MANHSSLLIAPAGGFSRAHGNADKPLLRLASRFAAALAIGIAVVVVESYAIEHAPASLLACELAEASDLSRVFDTGFSALAPIDTAKPL